MYNQNSISPLQNQNLQLSNNSKNLSKMSRNMSSGKKSNQFQNPLGGNYPMASQLNQHQQNLRSPIPGQQIFQQGQQMSPFQQMGNMGQLGQNQGLNQNALFNANSFNRTNLLQNFNQGSMHNSLNNSGGKHNNMSASSKKYLQKSQSSGKRNKNQQNKTAPLIQELHRTSSGKKLQGYQSLSQMTQQQIQQSSGGKSNTAAQNNNQNFLLTQLNLAGQMAQAAALGKTDTGYLAQQTQNNMYSSLGMTGQVGKQPNIASKIYFLAGNGQGQSNTQNKGKNNRDKIERIFGRMRIGKKDKNGREKQRKLRQKMLELRKIVFENRDD